MHIFGYVTYGFQSLNHSAVLNSLVFLSVHLVKSDDLQKTVYEVIRSTGSQRPRLYGLPKIHKQDVPCRPILLMIGSAQYNLAKFLGTLLQPVLELYSTNCINDSF